MLPNSIVPPNVFDLVRARVENIRLLIARVSQDDFPYPDGLEALEALDILFSEDLRRLGYLAKRTYSTTAHSLAVRISINIWRFHPILGFIIRSTNVRNPFEVRDPLLRLSREFIGEKARLILSSEWEYSPYTYPLAFRELSNFVLIGLPAAESDNSLTLPLAGHELGHSVWIARQIYRNLEDPINQAIYRNYSKNRSRYRQRIGWGGKFDEDQWELQEMQILLANSETLAKRQVQEVFCDLFGLALFGASFAYAFAYFLAPSLGSSRDPYYPTLGQRVGYIRSGAKHFDINLPEWHDKVFFDDDINTNSGAEVDQIAIELADLTTKTVFEAVLSEVEKLVGHRLRVSRSESVAQIFDSFVHLIPAQHKPDLTDVICAGWEIYLRPDTWDKKQVPDTRRLAVLNDLILKTIEVSEFETRIGTKNP